MFVLAVCAGGMGIAPAYKRKILNSLVGNLSFGGAKDLGLELIEKQHHRFKMNR